MFSTYLRLILVALFWGGTFVAARAISQDIDPYSAAFLRFLLATCILIPMVIRQESRLPVLSLRQMLAILLLGLSGIFAYNIFFFSGLQSVEAGRAAVIIAANPVFIALFSFIFFRELFPPLKVLGILLSVTGAIVVISRGDLQAVLSGGVGQGELYLLGCVASWVAYTLIGKRVLSGMSPLAAVAYSSLAGSLMLLPLALEHGLLQTLPGVGWKLALSILYLSLFGTVIGFVWFYQGVREIGPSRAGLFINLVPVSAVVFGILILGETPGLSLFAGGMLVLLGLLMANRQGMKLP